MIQGAFGRTCTAILFVLICAAASPLAGAEEDIVRFQSDLSRGHGFREPIGHGLVLILASTGDGWDIRVSPQTVKDRECQDFTWVVNPPFRNYNALYLNPSYGMTAQDAVDDSPREFNFVLNCAGYKRESTFVRRLIESTPAGFQHSEKQVAEAQAKLGTSPQGHGNLWILDYKISPSPKDIEGKNYGQIDWIRFRVEIKFPVNADSLPVPNDFEEPNIPRHTLTGTVRDTLTHRPVEGAKVSLALQEPALGPQEPVFTGANGSFIFKDVAEGPVNIIVEKSGFISTGRSSAPYSPSDSLFMVGPDANNFDIGITHLSTVTGRVTDAAGKPLRGVFVYLAVHNLIDGRLVWRWVVGQAVTDDNGMYSFPNLRPGQYVAHTLLHPIPSASGAFPIEAFLPQYYPIGTDFASAARLDLSGQELRADFTLSRGGVFRVSGHVNGLLDREVFRCQFADAAGQAMTANGWEYDPATAEFAIAIPEGRWTLWCDGSTGVHAYAMRQIKVENADVSGLQLELRRPIDIPINANIVHLYRIDPPTSGLAPDPDYVQVQTEIRGVPPVKYRVRVAPGTCAASVLSGSVDLLVDDLVVTDANQPAAVWVTRYSKCPTLAGTVHSQSGDSSGAVLVVSDSDHIEPIIVPFSEGKFRTDTLIPGVYHVYAFRSLNGLEYANLEVLREYPGQTVRLEKDQSATVNLELIQRR